MRKPIEFRGGLKLAGHPMHTVLIHFPIAFLSAAPLLLAAGMLGWEGGWSLAFWAQAAGVATALPAAAAGLADFAGLPDRPATVALANRHMMVMLAAVAVAGGSLYLQGGPEAVHGGKAIATLGLSLCSLALLVWGGWQGGELVFRHGIGQEKD